MASPTTEVQQPPLRLLRHLRRRQAAAARRRKGGGGCCDDAGCSDAACSAPTPAPPAPLAPLVPVVSALPDVFSVPSASSACKSSPAAPAAAAATDACAAPAKAKRRRVAAAAATAADAGVAARLSALTSERERCTDAAGIKAYLTQLFVLAEEAGFLAAGAADDGDEDAAELRRRVLDAVALTMIQEGWDNEEGKEGRHTAATFLRMLGYRYRLSSGVLRYRAAEEEAALVVSAEEKELVRKYVTCYDDALPAPLFRRVQHAFRPDSAFWSEHGYGVGTPYFSYRHDLSAKPGDAGYSVMDEVVAEVARMMRRDIPGARAAKYAEWWAHRRPHTHTHQLHFDSDNEGKGGVRNPLANCIIFLSSSAVGGPTLVTSQHHGAKELSQLGWFVHPNENRIVAYPASVLHGVLPGRGVPGSTDERRVTLMVALWGDTGCSLRPDAAPGASRPFPKPVARGGAGGKQSAKAKAKGQTVYKTQLDATEYTWPRDLECGGRSAGGSGAKGNGALRKVVPAPVQPLWCDVDKEENEDNDRALSQLEAMPHYELCFQGF